jgi:hypothetical protein
MVSAVNILYFAGTAESRCTPRIFGAYSADWEAAGMELATIPERGES